MRLSLVTQGLGNAINRTCLNTCNPNMYITWKVQLNVKPMDPVEFRMNSIFVFLYVITCVNPEI